MTNITHHADLVAQVERLGAELNQACEDAALLRRLNGAEAEEKRLTAELRAAQERLAQANAAAIQAEQDQRFRGFIDIEVTEGPDPERPSILNTNFEIAVTRLVYDGRESHPVRTVFRGFRTVPSDALAFLIEKHPERVPAAIAGLSDGDLWDAFAVYFVSLKRGYVLGAAA